MSSLRDLLDYADTNDLPPALAFGQDGVTFTFRGMSCAQGSGCDTYSGQRLCWCVPNLNVCKLRIEIWGGGGGGSGTQCRSMGVPGYSGQYNSRTLCADQVGANCFDGFCYGMCVALAGCCAACGSACFGCTTYVQGCGLNSFCARGGYSGREYGWCFGFLCGTYLGNCNCSNCGCTPGYCCWQESTIAPFNRDQRKAQEELGNCFTSINASYLHNDCCCFMGAGRKWLIPMPGGLIGKYGTQVIWSSHCCCCNPVCWICSDFTRGSRSGGIFPALGSDACNWGGPPGMGGGTGTGGCCYCCMCGGTGASGAVRVTMYQATGG